MNDAILDYSPEHWALNRRSRKNHVIPWQPYDYINEKERTIDGVVEEVATIFLTNKECPFRCLMCDLWKNTTNEPVPDGAIPVQIQYALSLLSSSEHIKLYNSGNFFDSQAIPPADFPLIAKILDPFKTVVVESHPRFIGKNCIRFNEMLYPELHVAVGLETAHPGVLSKLNKSMVLKDFELAVNYLKKNDISVRTFILLNVPFLDESEGNSWAKRSIDFAFDVGVECCVVIPTRSGNGILDQLEANSLFFKSSLPSLENVIEYGIEQKRGRVFAALWDIETLSTCKRCAPQRVQRIRSMNFTQHISLPVECSFCKN